MKNLVLILVTILIGFTTNNLLAQNEPVSEYEYKNVLKISPAQFANSTFEVSYERYFGNRKSSLLLSPAFLLRKQNNESLEGVKAMIQYRLYLTHLQKGVNKTWRMANIGFYAGPYAQGLYAKEDYWASYYDNVNYQDYEGIYTKKVNSIEVGVVTGFQFDVLKRFVVDIYLGGGVRKSDIEDTFAEHNPSQYYGNYGVLDREYTGVVPRGGFQLGINF